MVDIVAVILTFGLPMYIVKKVVEGRTERHKRDHEAKMAMLTAGNASAAGATGGVVLTKELADLRAERKLLVERIENLETIVCSVDYELNQKVARLIDEQRCGVNTLKRMRLHAIADEEAMVELSATSKLNADLEFLLSLKERGRAAAEAWLARNYQRIGEESTVDIRNTYL